MIARRTVLKSGALVAGSVGAAGSAVALFGSSAGASQEGTQSTLADLDPASVKKFVAPMPALPVLQPQSTTNGVNRYLIRQQEATAEIVPGLQTRVGSFQGRFCPPVIKATSGVPTVIDQVNGLAVPTSIHLHGAHVPESSDGGPMDLIEPGAMKTYTYPNEQPHANLWFHDHAHHHEAETVYRGLTGLYLITDETEKALPLPTGAYDVPIALRDAHLDVEGQFVYAMNDVNRSLILANGRAWPYLKVDARRYRFRIFNTSNGRLFTLRLSDGSAFTQIGSDGGLLPRPHTTTQLALSPGERADIVIDFAKYAMGTNVVLQNTPTIPAGADEHVGQVLQFRVGAKVADSSSVPSVLRAMPALGTADRTRDMVLSMDPPPGPGYINGQVYDHDRIDTEIPYGSTEIWTVTNTNARTPHNFHVHLVQFRVIERGGQPVTDGPESGWKDTVNVAPGETVRIQATFDGYRGKYVYHCHLIEHAAMGMMANMRIV